MYRILISNKLASVLRGGFAKQAASWEDLSYDAQREYLQRHPGSKRRLTRQPGDSGRGISELSEQKDYDFMPIPEIQAAIKEYQGTESVKAFKALYKNFLPMMLNTVKRVIGPRQASRDDVEDLKQAANMIFIKAIRNADPTNQGVISYFQNTLQKQLEGKSREIFRTTVSIGPKDRRLLRAVKKYLHGRKSDEGIDYDEMAREINKDPSNRITHATPDLISDLLQTPGVSLEGEVGGEDDKRKMHDVLGPGQIKSEDSTIMTPEEETIQQNIKSIVLKSIEALDDPVKERILKLRYGLEPEYGSYGKELGIKEISQIVQLPRSTVKRELERAEMQMKRNQDIQKLRLSKSVLRVIKAYDKHIRFEYQPASITKIGNSFLVDDFVVKKFGSQLICDCGKNCFHKDAVSRLTNSEN